MALSSLNLDLLSAVGGPKASRAEKILMNNMNVQAMDSCNVFP